MVGMACYIGEGCKWAGAILQPHLRTVMKDTIQRNLPSQQALSNLWGDKLCEKKNFLK